MFYFNTGVMLAMGAVAPFVWVPLDAASLAGIALMAVFLMLGQIFTIRAFRHAAVAIVAPFHYVSLLWATVIGFVVWHELPEPNVWWGAAIVIASGLYVIWRETHLRRRNQS
jgi:drug/metabolite transporter (DMT)-like permease